MEVEATVEDSTLIVSIAALAALAVLAALARLVLVAPQEATEVKE